MQRELARHNQRVALDPVFPDRATVGGIIATNDSGALRRRYGSLRDLVIGMTIVLADGTIARSGGKVVKNVAGYDLPKLLTGSFGTLGVITEVTFRLHPLPASTLSLTARSASITQLADLMHRITAAPLSLEAMQLRNEDADFALDIQLASEPDALHNQEQQLRVPRTTARSLHPTQAYASASERLFAEPEATVLKVSTLPSKLSAIVGAAAILNTQPDTRARCIAEPTGILTVAFSATPENLATLTDDLRSRLRAHGGSAVLLRRGLLARTPSGPRAMFRPLSNSCAPSSKSSIPPAYSTTAASCDAADVAPSQSHPPTGTRRDSPPIRAHADRPALRNPSFDAHNAPETRRLDKCVHCGFCLPACPTYVLWGEEMDSPRGRIYMMGRAALGEGAAHQTPQCPAHGQLPRLHGLHDRLPLRRRVRQADRRHARSGRAPGPTPQFALTLRPPLPQTSSSRRFLTQNACVFFGFPLALYQRTGLQSLVRSWACSNSCLSACAPWRPCFHPSRSTPSTRSRAHRQLSEQIARTRRHAHRLRAEAPISRTSTPPPRACSPPKAFRSSSPQSQGLLRRAHGPLRSRCPGRRLRQEDDRHLRDPQTSTPSSSTPPATAAR